MSEREMTIRDEILGKLKIKGRKSDESRQDFLLRVIKVANKIEDDEFFEMSEEAQD